MKGQIFGSALAHPWVLVKWNDGAGVPGQRPKTCVAYLTDDCAGHFLGGLVGYWRVAREPLAQWHYRFKRQRQFPTGDVVYVFNLGKSRADGPSVAAIRRAKRSLAPSPAAPG